jgi:endoglucanase
MKFLTTLFLAMMAITLPVQAATFSAKRGIALDIWVTWPSEDQWGDATKILPFPEWKKSVGPNELKILKDTGFDFVRMPIDPAVFLSAQTEDLRRQLHDEVLSAVDLAQDAGLKVIVDIHAVPKGPARSLGTTEILEDSDLFTAYLDFLRQLAGNLKDRDPSQVALELFNEPTIDCEDAGTNNWPQMLKQSFAAARSSATKLSLILSGACWGSAEQLAKLNPNDFPDDNLIWSFHSYEPFIITHQGASWTGDFSPLVYGLPFPLHEATETDLSNALDAVRTRISNEAATLRVNGLLSYFDELVATIDTKEELESVMDKPFQTVADWAKTNNIDPANIILGEFGIIRQEYDKPNIIAGPVRAAFYKSQIERAERFGFRWSLWGYGGAFGIVDEFEDRKAEPDVLKMIQALPPRQ